MPPKNMKKAAAAAATKTSAATSAVTATEGQKTKRKSSDTPGSIDKKQKKTNAGQVETNSEEGETDGGGEEPTGDGSDDQSDANEGKENDDDYGKCLVRPDKAWNLVEQSHIEKQPLKSYKKFLTTESFVSKINKQEVDEIIPPIIPAKKLPNSLFGEFWTRKDEDDLQKEWADHPNRDLWMGISNLNRLITMWKVFLRLFRKSPIEAISAKYALQYHPERKKHAKKAKYNEDVKKDREASPLWSGTFMEMLTILAHHPLWQGKVECLIVAIQYAVIVRTNDCRTWKLLNPTGDDFFNTMIRFIKQHEGQGMEMPELHKITRDDMQERGIPCGWFSKFMQKLEGRYKQPPPRQTEDNGPYKVSDTDLEDILKALTDMDHQGMPLFRYTGEGYGMEAGKFKMQNNLPSRDVILEYHERRILVERRWVAMQKKLADRERPVGSSTGLTASAEATGSGSAQTEIDQLNERIRELEDDIFDWQRKYKRLQEHNPAPSSDAMEDPKDNEV
ncbi:hypothetical protein GCG54_00002613 [Colletotrichum gloeosporioides]|uniref:Uncharacterized protein n=1 Tax=Colletotrichum gloeosporioides TaxID=474922 RepID=A0A8H4CU53_COLGL|nr:uncharacterized protein GCG54_00002613 [Colletotrichum gloeosporioides]KAF3810161.1 hypothetical protein GCG54_00002613 [Colletotrichum gloeosporioides]